MSMPRLEALALTLAVAACGPAAIVAPSGPPGDVYPPEAPRPSTDVTPATSSTPARPATPVSPARSATPDVSANASARPAASAAPVAPRGESRTSIEVTPGGAMGSLTRQGIAQAFEKLSPAIVACVDTHRDHRITTIGLAFTVQPSGKVSQASFPGYAGITPEGLGCVRSAMLGHAFPEASALGSGNVAVKLVQGGRN